MESDARFKIRAYIHLAELSTDEQRQNYIDLATVLLDSMDDSIHNAQTAQFLNSYSEDIEGQSVRHVYNQFREWCLCHDPSQILTINRFSHEVQALMGVTTKAVRLGSDHVAKVFVKPNIQKNGE